MDLPEFEMATFISLCQTDGCVNFEIAIHIETIKSQGIVVCGGCGAFTQTIELLEDIGPA